VPPGVVGVITPDAPDVLAHISVRPLSLSLSFFSLSLPLSPTSSPTSQSLRHLCVYLEVSGPAAAKVPSSAMSAVYLVVRRVSAGRASSRCSSPRALSPSLPLCLSLSPLSLPPSLSPTHPPSIPPSLPLSLFLSHTHTGAGGFATCSLSFSPSIPSSLPPSPSVSHTHRCGRATSRCSSPRALTRTSSRASPSSSAAASPAPR
jgi:hypothetical protein